MMEGTTRTKQHVGDDTDRPKIGLSRVVALAGVKLKAREGRGEEGYNAARLEQPVSASYLCRPRNSHIPAILAAP